MLYSWISRDVPNTTPANIISLFPLLLLLGWAVNIELMILLGFRYLASSIPLIVFAGVGVGVGEN